MKDNFRLARRLLKLARMLVAKDWTKDIQKKRPDLDMKLVNFCLDKVKDPKRQKILMYWLLDRKSIDLKKDWHAIERAFDILEREKNPDGTSLDYQKFNGPMDVITRNSKSSRRIQEKLSFNPDAEPMFSNKKVLGKGVVVYDVDDSFDGLLAVRRAIDAMIGVKANPWCLADRNMEYLEEYPEEAENVPEEYPELAYAWSHWKDNSSYPKRIAFKDGKPFAFCASCEDKYQWWDRMDQPKDHIPCRGVKDDPEFLKRWFPALYEMQNSKMTGIEKMKYMCEHGTDIDVANMAESKKLPIEIMRIRAHDERQIVKRHLAENKTTPPEILSILSKDHEECVVSAVAANPNCTAEILDEMVSRSEDWNVRVRALMNPNVTQAIVERLASPEALAKYEGSEQASIKHWAICSGKCPRRILEVFARDDDESIRRKASEWLGRAVQDEA